MNTKNKKLIIVLGMHRSGTSAITRSLKVLGVELGDKLIPTMQEVNAKGFWEDKDINSLNIEMLSALNTDWLNLRPIENSDVIFLRNKGFSLRATVLLQEKMDLSPIFGLKDPRITKLLPFWTDVIDHSQLDAHFVIAVRHPLSVAQSLAKRDALASTQSYLLWLEHVITSLADTHKYKRVLVDYDRLMQSPSHELNRIAKSFALEINLVELDVYTSEFLDVKLQHTLYHQRDLALDSTCPQLVKNIYNVLVDIASERITINEPALQNKFSEWKSELNALKPFLLFSDTLFTQIKSLNQDISGQKLKIEELNQATLSRDTQIEELNQVALSRDAQTEAFKKSTSELSDYIQMLTSSKSWNITKPIRWTGRVLRGEFSTALEPLQRLSKQYQQQKPPLVSTHETTVVSGPPTIHTPPIKPTHSVAVILPIYRDVEMTKRCIISAMPGILATPNAQLLAINDASPDMGMQLMLEELSSQWPSTFFVLKNETNLGFVQTVNRGLDYFVQHDVVLLNSDVIVPKDWLGRLVDEAYCGDNIGTVTPFSNNATICSFPHFLQENAQPYQLDVNTVDAVFSHPKLPCAIAPTGVGFCMYIRRACLDQIGYLNYEKFGRGYGEENDLCQRAIRHGWLNIVTPNLYAYHEGGVSFSSDKQALVDRAMGIIDELHPKYHADVQTFIKEDSLQSVRVTRHFQLLSVSAIPKILHISHALGGGVGQHIEELEEFLDQSIAHIILSPHDSTNGVSIRLGAAAHADTLLFNMPSDYDRILQLLQTIGISAVHFHHTVNLAPQILNISHDLQVPHILTVHDFYWLNGNPTLTGEDGKYHEHYSDEQINPLYPLPEGMSLEEFRAPLRQLIESSDKVIFPSKATKILFSHIYSPKNTVITPHVELHRNVQAKIIPFVKKENYTIGILGALGREKGADLLERLAITAEKENLPFQFKLLGYAYRPLDLVFTTGPYSPYQLSSLINEQDVDIIFFPAQWPETYSYTLSYALNSGLPIIAPLLGAFTERLSGRDNTLTFDHLSPVEKLTEEIHSFIEKLDKGKVIKSTSPSNKQPVNNFYEHLYIKIVAKNTTSIDLNSSTAILQQHKWLFNSENTNPNQGWRETTLSILWHIYMHKSMQKIAHAIPFEFKRYVKRTLSHRPMYEVIHQQSSKKP